MLDVADIAAFFGVDLKITETGTDFQYRLHRFGAKFGVPFAGDDCQPSEVLRLRSLAPIDRVRSVEDSISRRLV